MLLRFGVSRSHASETWFWLDKCLRLDELQVYGSSDGKMGASNSLLMVPAFP